MKTSKNNKIINKYFEDTYDISMPTNHNFVLDSGVIAHNCSHAVGYAFITYATMFLRHHYPLEWWASILTNASEKEITGKFWPYVKDMVYPPDINLSTDEMVVDYKNEKIRSKLGIVRGMGDKSIDPIIENRPYENIQDFVNKEVAAPSLSRKLIHVGILDSLFPKKANLLEKLKAYEDAVEHKKYFDKVEKANKEGRILKQLQPKQGEIPQEYLDLHPMKDAILKKSVLPTLPMSFFSLGKEYSKVLSKKRTSMPMVVNADGYDNMLVPGNILEAIDNMEPEKVLEDKYFACTCYIIDSKEFTYAKGSKRALKIILDADGYVSEKVLWQDYNTGELLYPKELKKGVIATIFMKKRANKKDVNILSIVVES
jgi:DNA polymerase III alpha subunit